MKSIGIVRRIDDLGNPLEIFTQGKTVVLKKYEVAKCTECNQGVDEEDKFCRHCGKEL